MRKLTTALAPFALLICVACASSDRAPRPEETSAVEPRPAPAETPPPPAPEAPPEDPAFEASRRAEEEVERIPPPPPPAELSTVLPTVLEIRFDHGAASLSAKARSVLDSLAERLLAGPADVYVELQGHADATGSEEANLRLAELRAEGVRTYLSREKGLSPEAMEVVPYGSAVPVADNGTADGRARNRRVVVVMLSPP